MKFSVTPILSTYVNKQGLAAILLQVIYGKAKAYPALGPKITPKQWKKNQVTNNPHKEQINKSISTKKLEIEGLLIGLHGKALSASELSKLLTYKKPSLLFADFTEAYSKEMKFKISAGRLKHYKVVVGLLEKFQPAVMLTHINGQFLQRFENWLLEQNYKSATIKHKISIIKAIVKAAEDRNIIDGFSFKGYKNIKVTADEPEFLTEDELTRFFDVCRAIQKPAMKLAGYYFLLSCLTGLRIGDAKAFNYAKHVREDEIIIRAKKNGKLVTIPLYNDLIEVLNYLKDKPFSLSEQKARIFVKELASLAGIKKNVKYHTSRHTATTRFATKGLNQKYVSDIIGDTEFVSRIYTHIDTKERNKKILELLN